MEEDKNMQGGHWAAGWEGVREWGTEEERTSAS